MADQAGLIKQARLLLSDRGLRESAGAHAYQVIADNSGALQKSMDVLKPIIEQQAAL